MTQPADRAPWLVLVPACAFVVAAPNVGLFYSEFQSYDAWRVLQVALLAAVAGVFVLVPAVRAPVRAALHDLPALARRGLGAVAVLGIVSALASARPLYALRQVALFALLFLLAIAAAAATRALGERAYRAVAQAVSLSALFYLTLVLAVYLVDPWNTREYAGSPFIGFANPRFFGQLQSWTMPLMVLPLLDGRGTPPLTRAAFAVAAAGWWMLFMLSGSRAPALSLALGAAVALACFGRKALPWLAAQCAALAAGVVAYNVFPWANASGLTGVAAAVGRGSTDTGRSSLWGHAVELARSSPWLGVGPGNYAHFREIPGATSRWGFSAHPHNAALQWGAEWGVPATLILAAVLLWAMWSWVAARRRDLRQGHGDASTAVALSVALVAAAVHSGIDGMIVLPLPQTVGALVAGLALGMHLRGRGDAPPRREPRVWAALAPAAAALAAAALLATLRLPAPRPVGHEQNHPGFWVHGAIP